MKNGLKKFFKIFLVMPRFTIDVAPSSLVGARLTHFVLLHLYFLVWWKHILLCLSCDPRFHYTTVVV